MAASFHAKMKSGIMRYKYLITLGGCVSHLAVLITAILLYLQHKKLRPDSHSLPDGSLIMLIMLTWPVWGFYLWSAAKKAKIVATIIPMIIGAIIILFFLLLFILGNEPIHM